MTDNISQLAWQHLEILQGQLEDAASQKNFCDALLAILLLQNAGKVAFIALYFVGEFVKQLYKQYA